MKQAPSFTTRTGTASCTLLLLLSTASFTEAGSLRRRVRKVVEVESMSNNGQNGNLVDSFSGLLEKDFPIDSRYLAEEDARFLQGIPAMSIPITPMPTRTPTAFPTEVEVPTAPPTIDERGSAIDQKCSQSRAERSRDILSVLTPVSEPDSLLIGNTIQFRARAWVNDIDPAIICATDADRIIQRYRAALIYYALNGDNWTTSTNWLTEANECEWFGLECNDYSSAQAADYVPIAAVRLDQNNLSGSLPDELFGLPSLEGVIMEQNEVSGPIPEGISEATQLKQLDLDFNSLSGELPTGLYSLPSITQIDLNNNSIEGGISDAVGQLSTLQVLNLEENKMTGEIPINSLLQIQELAALQIQNNGFTGTLEPICDVLDDRRQSFPNYGGFLFADCGGSSPPVECSCCSCLAA